MYGVDLIRDFVMRRIMASIIDMIVLLLMCRAGYIKHRSLSYMELLSNTLTLIIKYVSSIFVKLQ